MLTVDCVPSPAIAAATSRRKNLAGVKVCKLSARVLLFYMTLAVTSRVLAAQSIPSGPQIGYKPDAKANQKETLLLKDFHPASMLHVSAHQVERSKFYAIDVHNHTNDAAGIGDRLAPQKVIEIMDESNVKTAVILTGMWGDKLQQVIDEMVKPYPGRFLVFTQMDWSKINDPDFSHEMVWQLDDGVARGARGLKFLKDLGLSVRDKSGTLIAVDDARLDPVFDECGRLGIPVFIHTGDPEAFFRPINGNNERYEELLEHPDWSFYGRDFPGLQELLDARNRMFAKHPNTTFVSLHMGWPENLPWVASMLEHYPNVMVEFGAREAELGRQPRQTREFFIKYQDRVMFGTDNGMDAEMYRNHFRWLETADESFEYWGYPDQGRWKIYGLELPDTVLEKIYHLNAERLFAQFRGASALKRDNP